MIALDTSVLIRYFVQDDAAQAALATDLLENRLTPGAPALVPVVALHELWWVLRRVYGLTPDQVKTIIAELLDVPNLIIEHRDAALAALSAPAAFADALLHYCGGELAATQTLTFDKKFAGLEGVELLA